MKAKKGPTRKKTTARNPPPLLHTFPMTNKYSGLLKLPDGKLEDLISLRPYILLHGKIWVDELEAQQALAAIIEDPYDQHKENTDRENDADNDALDDDIVPQP